MRGENGGTILIRSWKCNFSIYLDTQAITTLLCLLLVLYVLFPSIHSFFYLTTALLKVTFSGTQKPTPPTVFNLQASDWVHCEEKTGAYYQLLHFTYKFVFFFYKFKKKKLFCPQKIQTFQKIPQFFFFFFLRDNWAYVYV